MNARPIEDRQLELRKNSSCEGQKILLSAHLNYLAHDQSRAVAFKKRNTVSNFMDG